MAHTVESIMPHFAFEQLEGDQREVAEKFHTLAEELVADERLSDPYRCDALRQLVGAKDAALFAIVAE
jgi:hypothetical protein